MLCSLQVVCITQFSGILLATKWGVEDPEEQAVLVRPWHPFTGTTDNFTDCSLQGTVIMLLNILVVAFLPLRLLMRTPALLKALYKAHTEGKQVRKMDLRMIGSNFGLCRCCIK